MADRHPVARAASLPTPRQELLLRAALAQGREAIEAWQRWEADVDWSDRVEDASYRLLPLAYENLQQAGYDAPILQKLKGIYRLAWYRNQTNLVRLAGVLRAFREAGVEHAVLKGTALVITHYRSFGLRPMSDVDVLVRVADVEAAASILIGRGWVQDPATTMIAWPALIGSRHAVQFTDERGHELDLHWHVLQESCQPGADDPFWDGAVAIEVGGEPTQALNPADQLLHVCVHGARWNELPPIRWVVDAMLIVRDARRPVDWDRLEGQTRARRLSAQMALTLSYLRDAFAAPVPAALVLRLEADAHSWLAQWELRYRNSDHRRRLLGYMPIFWFEYQRSRPPFTRENRLTGFARYLRDRLGATSLWTMPVAMVTTSPRVRRWLGR